MKTLKLFFAASLFASAMSAYAACTEEDLKKLDSERNQLLSAAIKIYVHDQNSKQAYLDKMNKVSVIDKKSYDCMMEIEKSKKK